MNSVTAGGILDVILWQFLYLFLGLGILVFGAQWLVNGASSLALKAGLTPLVVGLTVVAFGTSAPELAVSTKAALGGQVEMAVGNVVGSNIFNILMILGLSAAIAPLVVSRQLIRIDVPVMVAATLLFFVFSLNGQIDVWESGVLFICVVIYTVFLIRLARRETNQSASLAGDDPNLDTPKPQSLIKSLLLLGAGVALLVGGSQLMVDSAVTLAQIWGVSEVMIALTIVAAGTSLPELATSVLASIRGEREIAVGNIVGSNVFNLLSVAGISGLVSGVGLPVNAGLLHFDIPIMLATTIACLPIFFTGYRISRWEGFLFLAYYLFYTTYLILTASEHPFLPKYHDALVWFVLPLTGLTLAVVLFRWLKIRKARVQ